MQDDLAVIPEETLMSEASRREESRPDLDALLYSNRSQHNPTISLVSEQTPRAYNDKIELTETSNVSNLYQNLSSLEVTASFGLQPQQKFGDNPY